MPVRANRPSVLKPQALELLKMAKLAAMPRHRPRKRRNASEPFVPVQTGTQKSQEHEQAVLGSRFRGNERENLRPIAQLCTGDVDLHRAPRAAVEDFLANREPSRDEPARRRSKRNEHHARML